MDRCNGEGGNRDQERGCENDKEREREGLRERESRGEGSEGKGERKSVGDKSKLNDIVYYNQHGYNSNLTFNVTPIFKK